MTILEEPEPASASHRFVLYGAVLAAAVAAAVAVWMLSGSSTPGTQPAPVPPSDQARRVEPPVATPAPAPAETPSSESRRPARAPSAPKPAAPPPSPTSGTIQFDSDVPGASVFVDREYKGVTPLTVEGIAPGSHKVNASADGYDGYADTVEVVAGPNAVMVRFKDVNLNESIAVTHKHALGACTGQLLADTSGIRYETTKKEDAFTLAFAKIETFEVDYLKKNLRIKQKGGKTYNFTNDNADALFVFHKNVQAARTKLAKEGATAAPAR
jgi:hypothetical protein